MPGTVFEEILPELVKTIRASTSLAAQDVNFYHSLDSQLAKSLDNSGRTLLELTNSLIEASSSSPDEIESIPFGKDNISWKPVADILDSLYEKVDIAFDNALPSKKKNSNDLFTYLEDGNQDSRAPSKAILKPQLQFRNPIDNSELHPFKPKILTKPNSIKSFEESTKLIEGDDEEEEPPHYEHPYEYEIDNQPFPESILKQADPIPSKDWIDTSANWVDTKEKLEDMIESLKNLTEIAVDLEHHDYRTFYGLVCLMQISNREQDWIVDTLALRDDLEPLNTIFTNPNIVKVFHGAFMDIIWLQRDLGLYIVSLFDTFHASKKLGFPKFSLAYLLETFANFKTSKKYQLADWRIRPLLPPMLAYARSDTHFLLNIYDQLRNKLILKGDGRLQEVLYESRQVSKRRFEYSKFRPTSATSSVVSPVMGNPKEPFSNIMAQYRVPYHKMPLVRALYQWRDDLAKKTDESVRFIMPNQLLVSLSLLSLPVDSQKVLASSNYISDSVRANAKDLALLIESTIKEMDENDWELVDKLTNTVGNDSAFINDEQPDSSTIQLTTKAFNKLLDSNQILNSVSGDNVNLLNDKSCLLSDILENEKDQFSVEYDIKNKAIIKHLKSEAKLRIDIVLKHLHTIEDGSSVVEKVVLESINKIEKKAPVEEVKNTEDSSNTTEDDGLITLRKKSKKPVPKNISEEKSQSEPAFDYANADKIMLEASKKSRKDRQPKRSFDPYGSTGDGPQAAKKSKRVNSGKTSTFSKRTK